MYAKHTLYLIALQRIKLIETRLEIESITKSRRGLVLVLVSASVSQHPVPVTSNYAHVIISRTRAFVCAIAQRQARRMLEWLGALQFTCLLSCVPCGASLKLDQVAPVTI